MFLNRLSRQYELVIFGDEEQGMIMDVCQALDPVGQMIPGRFGREATLLKNGKYIKDLSYLNRPIKDIIYVDFDDSKVEFHKENAVILPYWDGSSSDRELYDLLPFLENLSQKHGTDVRKEIEKLGKEGTGKKYRDIMVARRDMIKRQRSGGL
jgi:import inner membrane translocase subunit TIM50